MRQIKKAIRRINRQAMFALLGLCMVVLAMTGAKAADQTDVTAELAAFQVLTTPDGKEKLQPTKRVKPGDVVEYKVAYRNTGKTVAKQLVATLPVPEGMAYIPEGTHPAIASASLDGKQFAPVPLMRWVRLSDGSLVQRRVPYEEYRSLRWELANLDAGAQTAVRARVRVNR